MLDGKFKKSSFSAKLACVEVRFKKSSFSATAACVEVKKEPDLIQVRDSKHQDGSILSFNREEWDAFIKGVKAGEFDI